MSFDDNWSDDTEDFTFFVIDNSTDDNHAFHFTSTSTETRSRARIRPDDFKVTDKPERAKCDVCGKERVQVRCSEHPKAVGCNYCHLKREHRA